MNSSGLRSHAGGCHCGAVRFEVELDLDQGVTRCNCTLCTKMSGSAFIVKPRAFRLSSGSASLSEYRIGDSPQFPILLPTLRHPSLRERKLG
jgi:hypothetical protein